MKDLHFSDYSKFAETVASEFVTLSTVSDIEYPEITIVTKDYEETYYIINALVNAGIALCSADLEKPATNRYDKGYHIFINWEGIWCTKSIYNGRFVADNADVTYISDNLNSKFLKYLHAEKMYVFDIGTAEKAEQEQTIPENQSKKIDEENCSGQNVIDIILKVNGKEVNTTTYMDAVEAFNDVLNNNILYKLKLMRL